MQPATTTNNSAMSSMLVHCKYHNKLPAGTADWVSGPLNKFWAGCNGIDGRTPLLVNEMKLSFFLGQQ